MATPERSASYSLRVTCSLLPMAQRSRSSKLTCRGTYSRCEYSAVHRKAGSSTSASPTYLGRNTEKKESQKSMGWELRKVRKQNNKLKPNYNPTGLGFKYRRRKWRRRRIRISTNGCGTALLAMSIGSGILFLFNGIHSCGNPSSSQKPSTVTTTNPTSFQSDTEIRAHNDRVLGGQPEPTTTPYVNRLVLKNGKYIDAQPSPSIATPAPTTIWTDAEIKAYFGTPTPSPSLHHRKHSLNGDHSLRGCLFGQDFGRSSNFT
jgi:hypothetical protein